MLELYPPTPQLGGAMLYSGRWVTGIHVTAGQSTGLLVGHPLDVCIPSATVVMLPSDCVLTQAADDGFEQSSALPADYV